MIKSCLGADGNARLQNPILIRLIGRDDAFVGVVVEGVGHRVRIHIIIWRELRFDIRY